MPLRTHSSLTHELKRIMGWLALLQEWCSSLAASALVAQFDHVLRASAKICNHLHCLQVLSGLLHIPLGQRQGQASVTVRQSPEAGQTLAAKRAVVVQLRALGWRALHSLRHFVSAASCLPANPLAHILVVAFRARCLSALLSSYDDQAHSNGLLPGFALRKVSLCNCVSTSTVNGISGVQVVELC